MRAPHAILIALAGVGIAVLGPARQLPGQDSITRKTFPMPHVLEVIGYAIDQPAPAGLSPADLTAYASETEWFKTVRTRIQATGVKLGIVPARETASGMATGRRQYRPQEITAEVETLKQALLSEGRKFNTLSNASKARHDMAMNAIRNMKA